MNGFISWIFVINLMLNSINAYFVSVDETKFHLAKSYLCRYGYMNENLCQQHADDSLKFMQNNARDMYRGLLIFQTMFNITRTGKIDEETIMQMSKPRCGNKDFDLHFNSLKFSSHKTNDFTALRSGLKKLTYTIRKYNPYLNRYSRYLSDDIVEYTIDRAFQIWLKHLSDSVKVTKLSESDDKHMKSNITIYFAEGNHGDSMLFDGIDGELAHSYSLSNLKTPFRGHIHLDDAENWNKDKRLLNILLHEIGHVFGLDHSSNPRSIMSPLFRLDTAEIQSEDVRNLRLLLGLDKHSSEKKVHMADKELKTTSTSSPVDSTTSEQSIFTTITEAISETMTITNQEIKTTTISVFSTITDVETDSLVTPENDAKQKSLLIDIQTDAANITKPVTEGLQTSDMQPTATMKLEISTTTTPLQTTTTEILTTMSSTTQLVETTISIEETTTTTMTTTTTTTTDSTTTTTIKTTTASLDTTTILSTTYLPTSTLEIAQHIDAIVEFEMINSTALKKSGSLDLDNSTQEIQTTISESLASLIFTTTHVPTTYKILKVETNLTTETVQEEIPVKPIKSILESILSTDNVINSTLNINETKTSTSKLTSSVSSLTIITEKNSTFKAKVHTEPSNLCEDPHIDAITRTEWGNAFVFKGDYVWHIRGLTKWRLFDYEGWPKLIKDIFPGLPSDLDSSHLYDDQYYFTKGDQIWKFKIASTYYPPKYMLVKGYPKSTKEEYPSLPFDRIDGAFAVSSTVFLFKDTEFWQSDWTPNITGKIPFKVDAVLSWRNPRLDTGLNEPLAYIISNSSMYKFNYWSFPVSYEALDIRYFLFDCVQANYQPNDAIFLGPSYKQAFIADDIYSKENLAVNVPSHNAAKLIDDKNKTNIIEDTIRVQNMKSEITTNSSPSSFVKFSVFSINILFLILAAF